ncbi:hypothetical protein A2917_00885 [Candidatus Nomurabacteria bacterium RIFCSPLOWO2_01_FULL_42_17]|uniref:Sigma-54 factor interaction domain-containing protein n=1 Tax=Candidatus Nomurabacteria bacterium RIFCSPLOWO2_01_FULL_42_17 TaxID=1801780 RepID=A0A1F6XM70_9BACT|nr:MAG: hypothetical protein A2917_00885 [Candidatus Nomurabacteria bacterium RIFCSPLOWO2_01_FULL_42_17]
MLTQELRSELQQVPTLIVGRSQKAGEMRELAQRLGKTGHTVLIQGETGTGKEIAAKEIHNNGRQNRPFVPVNCSAITSTLFESEMFGHREGSFTDAYEDRKGFFESVEDGTILLDEVGTLPLDFQVKLLRILEDGMFSPVGDRRKIQMKARVIASTNTDLKQAVTDGKFRSDLFYRLNVIPLNVPSLRDRLEDVPVLIEYFLSQEKDEIGMSTRGALMREYHGYNWPGNVRELKNAVARMAFFAERDETVQSDHVQPYMKSMFVGGEQEDVSFATQVESEIHTCYKAEGKFFNFTELHKDYLRKVLRETRGCAMEAASIVGVSEATLYRWIRQFHINRCE